MTGRLTGKKALITGAASDIGMGFATARLFADEGASVILTDIDEGGVIAATAHLAAAGARAFGRAHDVSNESDWSDVVEFAQDRIGGVDILVNNAGIAMPKSIVDTTVADFEKVFSVNVRGVFLGCRSVIPMMRATGGAIINFSSVAGIVGVRMNGAYAASKGAVRLLTKAVALEEAASGIRCNSVHPGVIDTEMVRSVTVATPEASEAIKATVPMGRTGSADEVARMVLFLASDEASYITGSEFVVDGGLISQ